MIRAWTVVLGLSLAGCAAKTAPVEMSMKRNMADDVTSLELKSVELNHAKDGWTTVSMGAAASTENGTEVAIGTVELPRGTYSGARVKYVRTSESMAAAKTMKRVEADTGDAADAEREDGKTMTRAEAAPEPGKMVVDSREGMISVDSEFCVSKDDNTVMIVVREKGDDMMLKVKGPGC